MSRGQVKDQLAEDLRLLHGVVAVFYKPENNILFLAKSGSSDLRYEAESALFFRTLTSANGFEDLLPFLARRSCIKVNKRISKLRDSLETLYDELLDAAKRYEPKDKEFHGPWYKIFIQILQAENQLHPLSAQQVLIHTLTFLMDRLKRNPQFSDKTESHRPFAELLYAASTFLDSDFCLLHERRNALNRLGLHLQKLTDYLDVSRLSKVWQRYGRDTCIKWITNVEQSGVPRMLAPAGVGERHLEVIRVDEMSKYKSYMLSNMDIKYPGWRGEASEGITFVPCMHAEINLILYLMGSIQSLQIRPDEPLPIGCSQRSCFACSLWMDEFNRVLKMKWMTSRNNGQPRYDWVLPSGQNNCAVCWC
ncbi:hypothetical protein C0995_007936 [Termitomyces sp. Mi166|nr:hypothetical protein C0995_007936 [Termitomyces sp. Mi166\